MYYKIRPGEHTTQEPEIVRKLRSSPARQPITDRTAKEKYQHNSRRDPKWAVQIRVALKHIEEVGARVQGCPAALQHSRRIDIEKLRVERYGPQKALSWR